MTAEEKHFIYMCSHQGMVHGASFNGDKNHAVIKSKYSDPVYMEGYRQIIERRLYALRQIR